MTGNCDSIHPYAHAAVIAQAPAEVSLDAIPVPRCTVTHRPGMPVLHSVFWFGQCLIWDEVTLRNYERSEHSDIEELLAARVQAAQDNA